MNIIKYVVTAVCLAFILSCDSDSYRYRNRYLPDYNFSIEIDTNLPLYTPLNYTGNAVFINQAGIGINGIFVLNTGSGFAAYEASCPNQELTDCSRMELDGVIAVCPCDDVEYNLFSGQAQGQEYAMKPYRVQVLTETLIRVSN